MSQDRPHLPELLKTVRELLDGLGPKVAPEARYDVRVASFLVGVAEREVTSGAAIDAQNQTELATFLGREAPLAELEATLAERLRSGDLDERFDDVLAMLLRHVVDKVRIVRPSVLDERHRA